MALRSLAVSSKSLTTATNVGLLGGERDAEERSSRLFPKNRSSSSENENGLARAACIAFCGSLIVPSKQSMLPGTVRGTSGSAGILLDRNSPLFCRS